MESNSLELTYVQRPVSDQQYQQCHMTSQRIVPNRGGLMDGRGATVAISTLLCEEESNGTSSTLCFEDKYRDHEDAVIILISLEMVKISIDFFVLLVTAGYSQLIQLCDLMRDQSDFKKVLNLTKKDELRVNVGDINGKIGSGTNGPIYIRFGLGETPNHLVHSPTFLL